MPVEGRCALASLTLDRISKDTWVQIPHVCVALWKEKACNAFFYLLGKVQPSTRLSHLVPPGDKFTVEAAAEGLFQTWKAKTEEPAERVKQADQNAAEVRGGPG